MRIPPRSNGQGQNQGQNQGKIEGAFGNPMFNYTEIHTPQRIVAELPWQK